jgi:RNA polymerase sigma-19 factor, ECF subfamily
MSNPVANRKTAVETYAEYRDELRRFFSRQAKHQDVDDLVQEMYARLVRYPPREEVRAPQQYLYRVAWMVLHRAYRRGRRHPQPCEAAELEKIANREETVWTDSVATQVYTQQELDRVLGQLPKRWQSAIILLKRDGCSYQEIAVELGISVHTVKKYVKLSLQHFKAHLKAAESEAYTAAHGSHHGIAR